METSAAVAADDAPPSLLGTSGDVDSAAEMGSPGATATVAPTRDDFEPIIGFDGEVIHSERRVEVTGSAECQPQEAGEAEPCSSPEAAPFEDAPSSPPAKKPKPSMVAPKIVKSLKNSDAESDRPTENGSGGAEVKKRSVLERLKAMKFAADASAKAKLNMFSVPTKKPAVDEEPMDTGDAAAAALRSGRGGRDNDPPYEQRQNFNRRGDNFDGRRQQRYGNLNRRPGTGYNRRWRGNADVSSWRDAQPTHWAESMQSSNMDPAFLGPGVSNEAAFGPPVYDESVAADSDEANVKPPVDVQQKLKELTFEPDDLLYMSFVELKEIVMKLRERDKELLSQLNNGDREIGKLEIELSEVRSGVKVTDKERASHATKSFLAEIFASPPPPPFRAVSSGIVGNQLSTHPLAREQPPAGMVNTAVPPPPIGHPSYRQPMMHQYGPPAVGCPPVPNFSTPPAGSGSPAHRLRAPGGKLPSLLDLDVKTGPVAMPSWLRPPPAISSISSVSGSGPPVHPMGPAQQHLNGPPPPIASAAVSTVSSALQSASAGSSQSSTSMDSSTVPQVPRFAEHIREMVRAPPPGFGARPAQGSTPPTTQVSGQSPLPPTSVPPPTVVLSQTSLPPPSVISSVQSASSASGAIVSAGSGPPPKVSTVSSTPIMSVSAPPPSGMDTSVPPPTGANVPPPTGANTSVPPPSGANTSVPPPSGANTSVPPPNFTSITSVPPPNVPPPIAASPRPATSAAGNRMTMTPPGHQPMASIGTHGQRRPTLGGMGSTLSASKSGLPSLLDLPLSPGLRLTEQGVASTGLRPTNEPVSFQSVNLRHKTMRVTRRGSTSTFSTCSTTGRRMAGTIAKGASTTIVVGTMGGRTKEARKERLMRIRQLTSVRTVDQQPKPLPQRQADGRDGNQSDVETAAASASFDPADGGHDAQSPRNHGADEVQDVDAALEASDEARYSDQAVAENEPDGMRNISPDDDAFYGNRDDVSEDDNGRTSPSEIVPTAAPSSAEPIRSETAQECLGATAISDDESEVNFNPGQRDQLESCPDENKQEENDVALDLSAGAKGEFLPDSSEPQLDKPCNGVE